MIRNVLVNLQATSGRHAARDYAISVAGCFEAHLTGIAFAYGPIVPGAILDGAVAVISAYREEFIAAAERACNEFKKVAQRQANLSSEAHVVELGSNAVADAFSRLARSHDLSIVEQAHPDTAEPEDAIIEGALFGSGRPVLIVPWIQKGGIKLDKVLVCWDGSRNAARAVADALPILRRAGTVEVITIGAMDLRSDVAGVGIATHLARHGLSVEVKSIADETNDVAAAILNHAADSGADLVVMGGYGHSRLRELVLGGATRGMLQSMTVPTLMSH